MLIKKLSQSFITLLFVCSFFACASGNHSSTLYEELGEQIKIEEIANNFIEELGYDPRIAAYFEKTNINRFYEKLVEHLCEISDGPCEYTGDSMKQVHQGMGITEAHFNQTVDMLIAAMDKANIPHNTQNKLLKRLVPLRKDIIYQ